MADRVIENKETEVPEIPELLEKVLVFVLEEAKEKMDQGSEVTPFTALIVKDNLFIENHPGESAEDCYDSAKHTVEGARGADAYAFCYDGYIETDAGVRDSLIAEGGIPGEPEGMACGYLYTIEGEKCVFESQPAYIGSAPNFMSDLKEADEYDDEEIEERYLDEDDVSEDES
ncbi:MAG: hypothetical protein ACOYD7_07495 [Raoultibacter sp.]